MQDRTQQREDLGEEIARVHRLLDRAIGPRCTGWLAAEKDDLVQKATMRILRLLKQGPDGQAFSAAYLHRVAFSVVIDEINQRKRAGLSLPDAEPRSRDPNPEGRVASRELGQAIRYCLGKLRAHRRRAATLMLLGYKNREIAGVLDWDAKQAENFVTRARADLRECLGAKGFRP